MKTAVLAELGIALQLVVEKGDQEITFDFPKTAKFILATNPAGTCVFIFSAYPGKFTDEKRKELEKRIEKAAQKYSDWSDFDATRGTIHNVTDAPLKSIGRAVSVTYRSDKWTGKATDYIHHFRKMPTVKADSPDDPTFLQVSGSIRVKTEGITG